jgi:GT2 family glycosyltransferase
LTAPVGAVTLPAMPPRARVIVSAYERLDLLRLALRGYLRQSTRDFSLVVADDGSGPVTRAFVDAFGHEAEAAGIPFEHHWQEDRGFRKTRILNTAVRSHRGEPLLVFSDGDCLPPARFVERHLAAHAPLSFHVGGAVRLSREASEGLTEADVDAGRFERLVTAADRRDLARRARKSRWGVFLRRSRRPKCVGLNMAFDRTLLEAINGFDERFEGWGLEDSDLRDRAMRHRPRPAVRVLYGENDVFHLWHPVTPGQISNNREYYETARPVRCEAGLVRGG